MRKENVVEGLDGSPLDKSLFDKLFTEVDTYSELGPMMEKAAYDVSRSEFDGMKEHSILYHIAGISNTIYGAIKALKHLENEAILLGIDLSEEMDMKEYEEYKKLKEALKSL